MPLCAFSRAIGPMLIDVVLNEDHISELEITQNPVEFGADVTDHAYAQPKVVNLTCATGQSRSEAAAAYQKLVALQESRVPFVLVTPIYIYRNMLIRSLNPTRDSQTSNILMFTAEIQEIILVNSAAYSRETTQPQATSSSGNTRAGSAAARTTQSSLINSTKEQPTVSRGNIAARSVPTQTAAQGTPESARNRSILASYAGL